MAKTNFEDYRRKIEADMREWAAGAGLALDALITLAETTRRYLDKVGSDLESHDAPKPTATVHVEKHPKFRVTIRQPGIKPRRTPARAGNRLTALLDILRASGKEMRVFEVQRAAEERGLHMSAKQISTVLSRAADRDMIAARKPGKNYLYKFKAGGQNGAAQLPLEESEQDHHSGGRGDSHT